MEWLVWSGAALSAVGIVGLLACVFMAWKARRDAADDEDLRRRLQKVVAWNLGAL